MMYSKYKELTNNAAPLKLDDIPLLSYDAFFDQTLHLLKNPACHCVNLFAVPADAFFTFYACIANDEDHLVFVYASRVAATSHSLPSMCQHNMALGIFEREIYENYGIFFEGHPWLKPVRFAFNRADQSMVMDKYPFYSIASNELHEVGVGPIHAGVIEPGHFRFICNGEKVLHLEIHLGYQHRGVEKLFLERPKLLHRMVLSENIAGDSAVSHALAFAMVIESLAGVAVPESLEIERMIAQELERLAVHAGDLAGICADVAFQLGQVVFESLRTTFINSTQLWCGNRFGKGLVRIGGSHYPLSDEVIDSIDKVLVQSGARFTEMTDRMLNMPSVLARLDNIGNVTETQARLIGSVGMAAKICGIARDTRSSHPYLYYKKIKHQAICFASGDALALSQLRKAEAEQCINRLRMRLKLMKEPRLAGTSPQPMAAVDLQPNSFALSLSEGWRGEICHCAITDERGQIAHYKVKDPSMHNWLSLALAVRNQEISDFPICNKSYNQSYCGFDL